MYWLIKHLPCEYEDRCCILRSLVSKLAMVAWAYWGDG